MRRRDHMWRQISFDQLSKQLKIGAHWACLPVRHILSCRRGPEFWRRQQRVQHITWQRMPKKAAGSWKLGRCHAGGTLPLSCCTCVARPSSQGPISGWPAAQAAGTCSSDAHQHHAGLRCSCVMLGACCHSAAAHAWPDHPARPKFQAGLISGSWYLQHMCCLERGPTDQK